MNKNYDFLLTMNKNWTIVYVLSLIVDQYLTNKKLVDKKNYEQKN